MMTAYHGKGDLVKDGQNSTTPTRRSSKHQRRLLQRSVPVLSRRDVSEFFAIYVSLGDNERALRWLEETAPGDIQANWLRVDLAFDPLRENPRFMPSSIASERKPNE